MAVHFGSKDRSLSFGSMSQDRPILDQPSTFARQSTFTASDRPFWTRLSIFTFFNFKIQSGRISENICCSRMLQLQADAMIFVKNRLGKFYEQITWQIFTNVWQIFTNVWQIFTNVWENFTNVWQIATNV